MSENTNYNSRVYDDPAYRIAKGMYLAIGGDPNVTFDNTDAIYAAINDIYGQSGGRINIEPLDWWVYVNGTHEMVVPEGVTGYNPITLTVEVPQKYTDEYVADLEKTSYNEGYEYGWKDGHNEGYSVGESEGYADGYAEGLDDGAEEQKALLESITITENGTYNRDDGWNEVVVEIETDGGGGGAGFDYIPIGYEQSLQNMLNQTTQNHIAYAKERLDYFNSRNTIEAQRFFANDTQIVFAPKLDLNTRIYQDSTYTMVNSMFNGATKLEIFPGIIGKPYGDVDSMFYNCKKLHYVGHFDTSKVTRMSYMFYGCESLTTVPLFDMSNVTSMDRMFQNCTNLTTVPVFYTSKVTSMSYMFNSCSSLTTIPQFDTSSVTNMNGMLHSCTSLTTVPQFDTSKVSNMGYMFYGCSSLTTVPQFDASKVTSISSMFQNCTNLTDVGGLINLGMQSNFSTPTSKYSGIFSNCKNITRESVINVFNGLYDRASAGYSNLKLFFEADVINRLTEDDIAIATNKGWTISQ